MPRFLLQVARAGQLGMAEPGPHPLSPPPASGEGEMRRWAGLFVLPRSLREGPRGDAIRTFGSFNPARPVLSKGVRDCFALHGEPAAVNDRPVPGKAGEPAWGCPQGAAFPAGGYPRRG